MNHRLTQARSILSPRGTAMIVAAGKGDGGGVGGHRGPDSNSGSAPSDRPPVGCDEGLPLSHQQASTRDSARIRRFLSVGYATILLTSCGGSSPGGWDGNGIDSGNVALDSNGAVLVGIAGVEWSVTNTTVSDSGERTTNTSTGVTDDTGEFEVASTTTCTPTTDPTSGKTVTICDYSGYQPPSLTIGGLALPALPTPLNGYAQARYALLDFGTAEFNVASFVLMGNSAPGDPLINGITLSPGFSTTDCPAFDWSTANIQKDAACFLTQANKDGVQHSWPSADTVNQFLQAQWLRVHAGMYSGYQETTASATYPTTGTLSGNSAAIVDLDGTVEGWLDYTGSAQPNSLPGIAWSGTLALTVAAQNGSLTYTSSGAAPLPDMTVTFGVGVNGAEVTYQTADGSLAGTTTKYDSNGNPVNPGMAGPDIEPAIIFPKYHFQIKDLSYTRPGQSNPDHYMLDLQIGYGSYAQGGLNPWPPLPVGATPPMWLDMYGQLNRDNTVTLHWYPDTVTKIPPTSKAMTLKFDPATLTLSGDLIGYDGSIWTRVTIQGWRT